MRQPIYDDNSNLIGYGKFIKDTTGENTGSYVDNELNDEVAAAENSYFFDAAIIPTVQYQVYGLDNVWFWDNEGQNYTFNKSTISTINVKVINGQTRDYREVSALTLGTETTGETSAPKGGILVGDGQTYDDYPTNEELASDSNAAVGQIYYKVVTGTPDTYSYKTVTATFTTTSTDTGGTEIDSFTSDVPAGAKAGDAYYMMVDTYASDPITTPYEFNKYGKEETGVEVLVTLAPNADLKKSYPGAIITVNGKEYDINHTSFKLYMDKDYRISINWVWGSVVETFRIICNR